MAPAANTTLLAIGIAVGGLLVALLVTLIVSTTTVDSTLVELRSGAFLNHTRDRTVVSEFALGIGPGLLPNGPAADLHIVGRAAPATIRVGAIHVGATADGGMTWTNAASGRATLMAVSPTGQLAINTDQFVPDASLTLSAPPLAVAPAAGQPIPGAGIVFGYGAARAGLYPLAGTGDALGLRLQSAANAGTEAGLTVAADGRVGVGTSTPQAALHVVGSVVAQGSFYALSDSRFKTEFAPIAAAAAARDLQKIQVYRYNMDPVTLPLTAQTAPGRVGWLAQEVRAVFPSAVSEHPNSIGTPAGAAERPDSVLFLNPQWATALMYATVRGMLDGTLPVAGIAACEA
jgi:hypothetical protein